MTSEGSLNKDYDRLRFLKNKIEDHYHRSGKIYQKKMDRHRQWKWSDYTRIKCTCGELLYPDCDMSMISIQICHFEHIIDLFDIPLEERITIDT